MFKTSQANPTDVLIIGAGPAGLSCASGLARLLHTCVVFSAGTFRNEKSKHMHGVLTWEHRDPEDFRAAARKDLLAHYDTISFEDVAIENIEKMQREDGSSLFRATDSRGGEWWGRKVALAMGVEDVMLDIEGYDECWAKGIFHCLFCHGYEERGAASAGVFAIDDCAPSLPAMHMAKFANRLADKVTIYTNNKDAVTKDIESAVSALKPVSKTRRNVTIEIRKIVKLIKLPRGAEIEVVFEDGSSKVEGFIAHRPKSKLSGRFAEQLGLDLTPQGDVKVSPPFNETSVAGVFAGGDCGTPMKSAFMALSAGGILASGLAAQLEGED